MSRVINFDKGSKRRINQIRWTPSEIASAILLSLMLLALGVLFIHWEVSKYEAPTGNSTVWQKSADE